MTKRDIMGIIFLIVLFAIFIGILIATVRPMSNKRFGTDNNVFVQQRLKNLEKSK